MSLPVVSNETFSSEREKKKTNLLVSLFCFISSLVFISFTSALIFSIPFLLLTLGSFLLLL